MNRLFGIETEYGISTDAADVVRESMEVVRAYAAHGVERKWNYALEDPHRDARGFRVHELRQDTDEANYSELDSQRTLSFEEIKSDLALTNGARFYNDHSHPEYSTPECTTLRQVVAQDKAGERILLQCARDRGARLYKNNTDFAGHSYGCHENYLLARETPWERLVSGMMPFLVTRQIFAGAGKLGLEEEDRLVRAGTFQISQRADFFSVLESVDTMNRRPIINTRDEPHADAAKWRRFHVIVGDANMNEVATALKIGTTALVLELIERGDAPKLELAHPVDAFKAVSRDASFRWLVELSDGRRMSAVEIQRLYLAAARQHCELDHEEKRWVLDEWESILDALERDPLSCTDRVDWAAKHYLLSTFREAEGLNWSDPWLQSLDMEYHNIDPEAGLYHEMLRTCAVRRFVDDDEICNAVVEPPATTRAFFRGRAVAKFRAAIASIQWDEIVFQTARGHKTVSLAPLLYGWGKRIENAETVEELCLNVAAP